ncbi:hypothetical protein D1872_282970 [compost metagenome]
MTVFMGTNRIFTIVNMNDRNPVQADQIIKLAKHTVEIIYNVIPGIVNMASIHTNCQPFIMLYFIDNRCNFLKAATYLSTFSRHRFKSNIYFSLTRTV